MGNYYGGRNVLYIYIYYVRMYSTYVTTTHKPFEPHTDKHSAAARACVFLSFSLHLSFFEAPHDAYGRRRQGDTSPCLPHGPYTSNTLRVSQLTPSQTFHFVVQRARHGAHDGSHKWKPSPVGSDATVCFSFPRWAEMGNRTLGANSVSGADFSYPEDRSHFCADPSGLVHHIPSFSSIR